MGCYNIHGFYSHLPIKCGDRVGAIICAKKDERCNLAMDTINNGIYPIMTPIYGKYNDYGTAENMDATGSVKVFEDLIGIEFAEFVALINNYSAISINSNCKDTEYNKPTEYQKIIKKLIPPHYTEYYGNKNYEDEIAEAEANGDTYMVECYKNTLEYDNNQKQALLNSTFLVIYEHEDILKQFVKLGEQHLNSYTWNGEKRDASNSYDKIAAYANLVHCDFFNVLSGSSNPENKEKYFESVKLSIEATIAEKELFADHISFSDWFGSVYRVAKPDYNVVKDDIMELLYLDAGMKWYGATYSVSMYAGQEIHKDEWKEMNKIFTNITDSLNTNNDE